MRGVFEKRRKKLTKMRRELDYKILKQELRQAAAMANISQEEERKIRLLKKSSNLVTSL